MRYKLGLIGYGVIGKIHHQAIENTSAQTGISLVAIADLLSTEINDRSIHFTNDYQELLQDTNIDLIAITTPPDTHFEIASKSLLYKKSVILEKPPVIDLSRMDELNTISMSNGRILFTAFHAIYRPEIEIARELLKSRKVTKIDICYKEFVLNYHDKNGWIFKKVRAGGGVLMDSGINAISLVTAVMPDIDLRIKKATFRYTAGIEVETYAKIDFEFDEFSEGKLEMNWMHEGDEVRQVTFETENGDKISIDIVAGVCLLNDEIVGGEWKSSGRVDQLVEYEGVYNSFARYLSENKSLVKYKELKFVIDAYRAGDH